MLVPAIQINGLLNLSMVLQNANCLPTKPFQELEGVAIIFVLAKIVDRTEKFELGIAILTTFIAKKQRSACHFFIHPVDMMIG